MAEQNVGGAGAAANGQGTAQPQMAVQHIFLKDCSFEAPGALGLDQSQGQPEINLNLGQRVNALDGDRYEIVLTVTVTAKQGNKTAFIAEVHQAGVFLLQGFNQEQLAYVANVHCASVLYPYARAQVSALVTAGGFFMPALQPISFEAIHAQRVAQQQNSAQAAPAGESGTGS